MKEKLVNMFLLLPARYNSRFMVDSLEGTYSLTIPAKDANNLREQDALDNFILEQYLNLFFGQDAIKTQAMYEFYMKKKINWKICFQKD